MDISWRSLEIAKDRLNLDRLSEKQKARIGLVQGSLMYRDQRIAGFDAATVVEVIEHLDTPRLAAFERVLFAFARPTHAVENSVLKQSLRSMSMDQREFYVMEPQSLLGHHKKQTDLETDVAIGIGARLPVVLLHHKLLPNGIE